MGAFNYDDWPGSLQAFKPLNYRRSYASNYCPMKILKQDIIGFKKVYYRSKDHWKRLAAIATLLIPEGAFIRISNYKFRANMAWCMSINTLHFDTYWDIKTETYKQERTKLIKHADSGHDLNFKYQVGKMHYPNHFDEDATECSGGIHFFLMESEARKW